MFVFFVKFLKNTLDFNYVGKMLAKIMYLCEKNRAYDKL